MTLARRSRQLGEHRSQRRLVLHARNPLPLAAADDQHKGGHAVDAESLHQVGTLVDVDLYDRQSLGLQTLDNRHHHLAGAAVRAVEVIQHVVGSGGRGGQTEDEQGRIHNGAPERCGTQQMRNRPGKRADSRVRTGAEPAGRRDVCAKKPDEECPPEKGARLIPIPGFRRNTIQASLPAL